MQATWRRKLGNTRVHDRCLISLESLVTDPRTLYKMNSKSKGCLLITIQQWGGLVKKAVFRKSFPSKGFGEQARTEECTLWIPVKKKAFPKFLLMAANEPLVSSSKLPNRASIRCNECFVAAYMRAMRIARDFTGPCRVPETAMSLLWAATGAQGITADWRDRVLPTAVPPKTDEECGILRRGMCSFAFIQGKLRRGSTGPDPRRTSRTRSSKEKASGGCRLGSEPRIHHRL